MKVASFNVNGVNGRLPRLLEWLVDAKPDIACLQEIKTSDDRDIFEVIHFTEEGADTKMMKRQSHDRVRQMLDLLPEDQREVIILRHYADLSFKEIAALTNCSINTALGRMRYGLINLRKMMTEKKIAL